MVHSFYKQYGRRKLRKPGLNSTRENILQYIHGFIDERGYSPTVRDILKGCDISSTAVVQYHLDVLEKEGRIHRDPEIFRSIRLSLKKTTVQIPILGTIAAGTPIPVPNSDNWSGQATETLELPQDMVGNKPVFALRVKGQSMIEDGILDGDFVIVERNPSPHNGDVVVALLDNAFATLKRFYREPNRIRLQPANSTMDPIYVRDVSIQGVVRAVIRQFARA
jgi:repressor LexA